MYRIFIVEDDPTMANAMKEKIESWGNEARIVERFSKCYDRIYGVRSTSCFDGYHASVF